MSDELEAKQRLKKLLDSINETEEKRLERLKLEVEKYAEIESKLSDIEARKQALALRSEAEAEYQERNLKFIKNIGYKNEYSN